MASTAFAQDQRIGSYGAYLGPEDLVNSKGVRLTTVGQIVQQDRANYHRFGIRHQWDEYDPWFGTQGNRAAIPGLVVVSSAIAPVIVRQGAYVAVVVYGDACGRITRLVVEIPG